MKIIPLTAIPELIKSLVRRGARPFTVALRTEVGLLAKSRDNGDVPEVENPEVIGARKISVLNCFLNVDYEGAVNRQRDREDKIADFVAREMLGRKHTSVKGILTNTDETKLYLQLKVESVLSVEYVLTDGTKLTKDYFEETYWDYMKTNPKANRHNFSQGTSKPIVTMTPALTSIVSFNVDGESYMVGTEKSLRGIFTEEMSGPSEQFVRQFLKTNQAGFSSGITDSMGA